MGHKVCYEFMNGKLEVKAFETCMLSKARVKVLKVELGISM